MDTNVILALGYQEYALTKGKGVSTKTLDFVLLIDMHQVKMQLCSDYSLYYCIND